MKTAVIALGAMLAWLPGLLEAETGPYRVEVEAGVRASMRDGVELVADIYRPVAPGSFPVLLQRTPYDRRNAQTGVRLASHGYLVVLQDTRGRHGSGGVFYPFRHEGEDGYDSVVWASGLRGSDGRVGMFGGSYVGATQMLAAAEAPPGLEAIFPYVTASEYYEGWTYQGGALMAWFTSTWASGLAEDTLERLAREWADPLTWVEHRPLAAYPLLSVPGTDLAPYYRDWLSHETDDAYWQRWKVKERYGEMRVKALHGAGWHDIFLRGSLENYQGLSREAATAEARAGQRLLVGPWCHGPTTSEGKIGDVVFGESALVDLDAVAVEWFDWALKGAENRFASGDPVRLFVMGENRWSDEAAFPPPAARELRYYLHGGGARGGTLEPRPPGDSPATRWSYDPADPVPTLGGRLCCGPYSKPGPYDQSPNDERPDVRIFETPPLASALEITGWVRAELYAASSAVDTDFTLLLADVDPEGYARFLTDGIVRARFRHSTQRPELLEPGAVERYEIDLWATSNVFLPGHRMRLYVSSSNFPRFDRNPNTGEPGTGSSPFAVAEQTLHHDPLRPSALVLPVVAR
jgi:hypothetical protein